MKRINFLTVILIFISIHSSSAQKLEKVYESSPLLKADKFIKNMMYLPGKFHQYNFNLDGTQYGKIIAFEYRKDSNTYDYINCDGRVVNYKRNIKLSSGNGRTLSDSARLISIDLKNGIFNIQIYDINSGVLIQNIKTTIKLGDIFKNYENPIGKDWYKIFKKDENHTLGGCQIEGNKLLVIIRTDDLPYYVMTPIWIDLKKPDELLPVFFPFPKLSDEIDVPQKERQAWDLEGFHSGFFIYKRYYHVTQGPNKNTNVYAIAEFDKTGNLINAFDIDLEFKDNNSFHLINQIGITAMVSYEKKENVFYVVSSVKGDKKTNSNKPAFVIKKINNSGQAIWEKIQFYTDFFKYEDDFSDGVLGDVPVAARWIILNPLHQTFTVSVGISNQRFKHGLISYSYSTGEFLNKKIISLFDEHTEFLDPKLQEQVDAEIAANKYDDYFVSFYPKCKTTLVLFKTKKNHYAVYKYID